jgi:uncharacterized protein (TIGR02996 family)
VPDHVPFLTALAERPGDDTLRLVYADWLDEHGLPDHAAFLRLEVRLRRAERGPGWFALCRAFLRAARATPDDWRELVSRPRLAGTTWRWTNEATTQIEEIEFQLSGQLRYRYGYMGQEVYQTNSPGTWRQFGPRVEVTVDAFSLHRGTIRDNSLPLRGHELKPGERPNYWLWVVTRVPGPDCIPDRD